MIKTKFKLFLEEVQTMNSDKEVRLKDYQEKINYYNNNKNKFNSILSKEQEKWEEEAQKIINGNIYLGKYWKLSKIEKNIKNDQEKVNSQEISLEEKQQIQKDIQDNNKKLTEIKKEIENKIKEDLKDIQES